MKDVHRRTNKEKIGKPQNGGAQRTTTKIAPAHSVVGNPQKIVLMICCLPMAFWCVHIGEGNCTGGIFVHGSTFCHFLECIITCEYTFSG